jgi:hypothetical protein
MYHPDILNAKAPFLVWNWGFIIQPCNLHRVYNWLKVNNCFFSIRLDIYMSIKTNPRPCTRGKRRRPFAVTENTQELLSIFDFSFDFRCASGLGQLSLFAYERVIFFGMLSLSLGM